MSGDKFSKCLECGFSGECDGCENREIEDPKAEYVLLIQWDTCYKTGREFLHVDIWDWCELHCADGGPNSGSSTELDPTVHLLRECVKTQVKQELHRLEEHQIREIWYPVGMEESIVLDALYRARLYPWYRQHLHEMYLEDVPVHARYGTLVELTDEWYAMADAHIDAEEARDVYKDRSAEQLTRDLAACYYTEGHRGENVDTEIDILHGLLDSKQIGLARDMYYKRLGKALEYGRREVEDA